MDVDLLRPGTVPISPDTIFWFEFLLDKELLVKHLQKPVPDPSPAELITKFTSAVFESLKNRREVVENGDLPVGFENREMQSTLPLKIVALKILSLKVAAYIKWNLVILRTAPLKVQLSLMLDLLHFTNETDLFIGVANVPVHTAETPQHHLFALIIFHRWILGSCMNKMSNHLQNRNNPDLTPLEENLICTPENIDKSLIFLNDIVTWDKVPPMLTYDCFVILSEHSTETQFAWDKSVPIPKEELRTQIHYELAAFYFFREEYELATEHFLLSMKFFKEIDDDGSGFCYVDFDCLENYLLACNNQGKDHKSTLLQQLSSSIANQYTGILNILIQDNKFGEIPITYRLNLELDIQAALSTGKFTVARDLLPKIQALNAVRCIVSQSITQQYNYKNPKSLEYLLWATSAFWNSATHFDKNLLCIYFEKLIIRLESDELLEKILNHDILNDMFDHIDVEGLKKTISKDIFVPPLLRNQFWDFPDTKRNPKLEVRLLEQQVISCYDYKVLRDLITKLAVRNPNRHILKINPRWELPIPLQSVVTSIPRGFLQDFSYVMLAKSKELMLSKNWNHSIEFLKVLDAEVLATGSHQKLSKLINWEILLVQITNMLEEWPTPQIDRQALAQNCETCLKNVESVIPRTEIMEQSILCLLNLARWDFLITLEKPWAFFEIAVSIARACQDIVKHKSIKKVNKELWELVIPIFATSSSSQTKRSSSGSSSVIHRDSPINSTKIQLLSFFSRLRDLTVLSVVISMLSKLYNIVRDDGNLEVNIDYIMLWPSAISNINSYNIGAVSESLSELLLQALKFYPTNIPWLRLMGDVNFSNSNYETALKYYLQSLIVSSEYFNLPVRADDHIFRRMIKSCTQLGCHTQAAVLCQFLEEPDYTLAFRSLVDFKSCNDSVEAYYHCFWDINILEYLVHLHNKKGEFQRRKKAIHTIGLLELNSNNNEEIQREAINLRKRSFLQAMCKQYVR